MKVSDIKNTYYRDSSQGAITNEMKLTQKVSYDLHVNIIDRDKLEALVKVQVVYKDRELDFSHIIIIDHIFEITDVRKPVNEWDLFQLIYKTWEGLGLRILSNIQGTRLTPFFEEVSVPEFDDHKKMLEKISDSLNN